MDVNMGNIFENRAVDGTSEKLIRDAASLVAAKDSEGLKHTVEQLKNVMLGDIFSGEVTSLENGKATIDIGNGKLLTATLLDKVLLKQGDNLMFMLHGKDNQQISLKILDANSQEMVMINKALLAAGMAQNNSTISMVKALLNNNMPIDKQTLTALSRQMMNFPDASADTLVRLNKLGIPVNESNITQFEAYRSYEHQISATTKDMITGFGALVETYLQNDRQDETIGIFSKMSSILSEEGMLLNPDDTKMLQTILSEENMPAEAKNLASKLTASGFNTNELFGQLSQLISSGSLDKETLSALLKSGDFNRIFEQLINKEFYMSPETVAKKDSVREFYAKMLEKTKELNELLSKTQNESQPLAKAVSSANDNVNFMNDLSRNMTFMQFPVKFAEGNAQGDLYVYTNKRSLREHPDNISALLHLDMENLGPMDIYVTLKGKNVNTNFCLESEEMLDFVYAHIDELNQRIDKLGFGFQFSMNIKEKNDTEETSSQKTISFTQDFTDKASPLIDVRSYIFDSKV